MYKVLWTCEKETCKVLRRCDLLEDIHIKRRKGRPKRTQMETNKMDFISLSLLKIWLK